VGPGVCSLVCPRRGVPDGRRSLRRVDLGALAARYHQAFNARDFDVWREVFDTDVELVVDGMEFRGVDAAVGYGVASVSQFPGLCIGSERVVAQGSDTVVTEIELVHRDPGGRSRRQGKTCEIIGVREGRIVSCRSYYMAEAPDVDDAVRVPARAEATRMAEERAALRRVAGLVSRVASQAEVFAAVNQEVAWLIGADTMALLRFDPEDMVTLVAAWSAGHTDLPIGASRPMHDELRSVAETGRTWRFGPAELPPGGPFVEEARELRIRAVVGVPVVVDGRTWGAALACSTTDAPFAEDAEERIAGFTELVSTAISNIEARADLAASRARIAAAADEERRRVVRDLHDGAQQRLVHTIVTLKLALEALEQDAAGASALVADAFEQAQRANAELRELAHGIMPGVLTAGGLRAGIEALASRTPVPVEIDVAVDRLPAAIEATVYFVVAEALTNAAKHAHATSASVAARVDGEVVRVAVRDDGVGGAQADGTGLVGLLDRLAVVDGRLRIESPTGSGTLVAADIPLRR
jgi:signal transduction histidine kinase